MQLIRDTIDTISIGTSKVLKAALLLERVICNQLEAGDAGKSVRFSYKCGQQDK